MKFVLVGTNSNPRNVNNFLSGFDVPTVVLSYILYILMLYVFLYPTDIVGYKSIQIMRNYKIPDETIRRLPLYWRAVNLMSSRGHNRISSRMLADIAHVNPWQIRKDLSYFGAFGTRGVGYDTDKLLEKISDILKLNNTQKAALLGVGNLGIALLKYPGFRLFGFEIVAAFDNNPKKIGRIINGIAVQSISKLSRLRNKRIHIGIITVPYSEAQQVARKLINVGVCGLLNFAPLTLKVPKKVTIINIDIALDLARLPYYMPARLAGKK